MNDSPLYSDLTDADWTVIEPLLPKLPGSPTGHDLRLVINGILFLIRSGSSLRTASPWSTAECYYWQWQADGTWDQIMAVLRVARPGTGPSPWPAAIRGEMF